MFSLFEWVAIIIITSILFTFTVVGGLCWVCIENTPLPDLSFDNELRKRVDELELSKNIIEEKLQQTINATTMVVYDMNEKMAAMVRLETRRKTKIPKAIKHPYALLPEISGDLK